jgi:hypothetical protein
MGSTFYFELAKTLKPSSGKGFLTFRSFFALTFLNWHFLLGLHPFQGGQSPFLLEGHSYDQFPKIQVEPFDILDKD